MEALWLCFLLFIFSCLPSLPFNFCLIFLLISFFLAFASAEIFFFSCFLFFTASSSLSGLEFELDNCYPYISSRRGQTYGRMSKRNEKSYFHFKSQLPHVNFHVTWKVLLQTCKSDIVSNDVGKYVKHGMIICWEWLNYHLLFLLLQITPCCADAEVVPNLLYEMRNIFVPSFISSISIEQLGREPPPSI